MMRRIVIWLGLAILVLAVGPPIAKRLFRFGPDPGLRPRPAKSVSIGHGLQLNVVDLGTGSPIVLVHGLPSCAADWATLPQKLAAKGHRVIAYDRIGYGYSSRAPEASGRYTYESNAHDLLALLDALGVERATLVGWSYGGAVVQTTARFAPERVAKLVLIAAVGPAQPRSGDDALSLVLASPLGDLILQWVASVPPLARSMTHDSLVQAFTRAEAIPSGWLEYTQAMLELPGTFDTFVLEAQRERPDTLHPETLRMPALIVQGSADQMVPPAVAEDLHRRLQGSQLVTIAGGSHMLPVTHADLLAERIHTFVEAPAQNPE